MLGEAKIYTTSPRGSHCCARSLLVFGVHSLPLGKERTKKTSGGYAPRPRFRRRAVFRYRSTALAELLLSNMPRLVRHRLPDGWARGSMPNFGLYGFLPFFKASVPPKVFAAFFKPQTQKFFPTKSSSRALESVAFHPKRLAERAKRAGQGRSPCSLLGYFLPSGKK